MPNPTTTWTKNVTTDDDYLPVNMRSVPTAYTLAPALYVRSSNTSWTRNP